MSSLLELKTICQILFSILVMLLADARSLSSQRRFTDDLYVTTHIQSGYNIPEYPFISALTKDYVRAFDLCISKQSSGENIWDQSYNYPEYGLSIYYSTLGNDEAFGREIALNYFFKIFYFSNEFICLYNRFGIGASYVNRKFNLQNNYLNAATGSHFNIHFNARLGMEIKLTERLGVNTGLSFDHFSNGNTSEPNLGINCLTGYTGIHLAIGKQSPKLHRDQVPAYPRNTYEVFISIGGKYSRALSSKYYYASSFSFEYARLIHHKFQLGIGADLFYDSSVAFSMEQKDLAYDPIDQFQSGIHLTQSMIYKKFRISFHEGVYLFLLEKVDGYPIYTRGVLQYRVLPHFQLRLTMKSHFHILDYPELGFGYRF